MYSCEFMKLESFEYFDFIITITGRVEEVNTNDLCKEIFDALSNAGYYDVTTDSVYIENDDIEIPFHVKGEFKESIMDEIFDAVEYFNILNDKILGLYDDATATEKEEAGELDVENLSLDDYKSMMDAWAREMRDKFAKEANLSREEIGEQIDDATKSFVSNMGILAQKMSYISGLKLYSNRIGMFCEECRKQKGIDGVFKCARELRAFFNEISKEFKIRGSQENIKTAMQLKELFGEEQGQGILGSIISGFYWIYFKIKNYFRNIIQVNIDDNSIIGKIINGAGMIINLVLTGVKIIFSIAGYIISFVATVVTKAVVKLYDAVKGILDKIKNAVKAFRDKN